MLITSFCLALHANKPNKVHFLHAYDLHATKLLEKTRVRKQGEFV